MTIQELIDQIANLVILPPLKKLSAEAKQPITVTLTIAFENGMTSKIVHTDLSENINLATGEVRLIVRDVDRNYRFNGEAIITNLTSDTGYSGFTLQGKLSRNQESTFLAKITGWTNRYNVNEWGEKFRQFQTQLPTNGSVLE